MTRNTPEPEPEPDRSPEPEPGAVMPPLLVWLAGSLLTAASVRSQEALVTVTALGQTPTRIDHLPARYLPMGPVMEVEGALVQVRNL